MYRNLCIGGAACDMRPTGPPVKPAGFFRPSLQGCIGETIAHDETVYCALSWLAMPTAL
jgi:hypothetical protein